MLDIKLIRKDAKKIEALLKKKEPSITLSPLLELDGKIRRDKTLVEELKADRNAKSKAIGELKRQGKNADAEMQEVRWLGEKIDRIDQELKDDEKKFIDIISCLPNLPQDDIKDSQDKAENVTIKSVGEFPHFDFPPKHHLELNEKLHLFDFQASAKTSGSGWPAYKGMGARLEWALINYMIETQISRGFEFWLPPLFVKEEILYGSGQIPKFEGQFYEIAQHEKEPRLFLVPTSETVLNGIHYDDILEEEALPIKYTAYTPCFRREAGAAGAHERGLIRMHQFNKVEMYCFVHPENSNEMLEEMTSVAEEIMEGLELHYRLSLLVTGDMSFAAAKTIDLEVWLPGQNRYYEVSSLSNCTDYQARRSHIRYRSKEGKLEFVHTLNGSGLATSRLLVALLENNQQSDGSVLLPRVLQEKLGVEQLTPTDADRHARQFPL